MKTVITLFLALAVAEPASAAWRRVDSPNFIVVGDVSVRTLRETAEKFEAFREVLRRVMSAVTSSSPVPTVVVIFPNDEAFTPFKPTYQGKPKPVAGYALPGTDVSYIAMVNDADGDHLQPEQLPAHRGRIVPDGARRRPVGCIARGQHARPVRRSGQFSLPRPRTGLGFG